MNIRARKRLQLRAIGFDYRRRFMPWELAAINDTIELIMEALTMSACIKRYMEDT